MYAKTIFFAHLSNVGVVMSKTDFVNLPFFVENGWIKKKCPVCGRVFWTLDPERRVCGDQPCEEYRFIRQRIGVKPERISQVRKMFLNFFEKNGHTPIKRYPVVARWRDDVYLVGASIYDFQPWVTEGIADPPANPLTISQPSIRLTDVDNVGRTGRHLTGFEMMAHHVFNIGGKTVYWANETVEFAFRLFTEVYHIPPEEITFVFDMWSGGGNAGEDYEVLVRGLEVATLVFMHYRTIDRKLIPMENKIVDTGYGLERIYWLLTGSTSVYEATFSPIIEYLRKNAGLEPIPEDLKISLARRSGRLDYKKPAETEKVLQEIAAELGLDVSEIKRILEPYESIYAIVDHTRTLMWMIGDGIVPSNTGAGYLARLLIRRSMRYLRKLGLELDLAEIVAKQIDFWREDFPEYLELKDEILDIIDYEERKYEETIRRGIKTVDALIEKYSRKHARDIPVDELIKLYESHGIPPDIVAERASKANLRVDFMGFYSKLAEMREKASKTALVEESAKIDLSIATRYPATRKLFHENEKLYDFEATVIGIEKDKYLILDRTAFYPESGGQLPDKGVIRHPSGECRVENVIKAGNVILHECLGKLPKIGDRVKGIVDAERRQTLMRHHTATHVVLGSLRSVLGKHVWQAGAQKTLEYVRFDFTHHKPITREQWKRIEELANKVVMENRKVNKMFMDRTQAEQKYGFLLYQGGVVPEKVLRVVEIEGWDAEACGGTHCDFTGEIGLIKILRFDKIQDGVFRVIFKAGLPAIQYLQQVEDKVMEVQRTLKASIDDIDVKVKDLVERNRTLEKELKKLEDLKLTAEAEEAAKRYKEVKGIKVIALVSDKHSPRDFALRISRYLSKGVIMVVNKQGVFAIKVTDDIAGKKIDARDIGRNVAERLGGRGGGVADLYQGRILNIDRVEETLLEVVEEKIGGKKPENI